jgi:hypothetical protein
MLVHMNLLTCECEEAESIQGFSTTLFFCYFLYVPLAFLVTYLIVFMFNMVK